MTETLIIPEHIEVFNSIKSIFSDFHLFDQLVADKLKKAIKDADNIELNMKTVKKVAERYFDINSFKTPEKKIVWAQIQLIFKSCYVLILSRKESTKATFWDDTETLLVHYPQFAPVDSEELNLLLNFRNMVKATLLVVPARLNKQCILKIAGRLEGSQNEYITGGGQKPAVTRRVQIYEQEGGITAEKRPDRIRAPKTECSETGSKRSASTFSEKKVKLIRLPTDEIQFLAKGRYDIFPDVSISTSIGIPTMPNDNEYISALPVANLRAASDDVLDTFMYSKTSSLELLSSRSTITHSEICDIPVFSRGTTELLNLIVPSSDTEFWKESLTCIETKPLATNLSYTTSQCFDEVNTVGFSDITNTTQDSSNTTTNSLQAIDMKGPLVLSRGFSLGFYSNFLQEDGKTISSEALGSIR